MTNEIDFFHYKNKLVDRNSFQADNADLLKYIREGMSQFEEKNMSRNYVGIDDKGHFVSLLCLTASVITQEDIAKADENFPKNMELPTIKIGRLVVDDRYRGQRIGERTLLKAVDIFVDISKKVGVIGLTVDSKEEAVTFYEKYGFISLNSKKNSDYHPMILYTNLLKKTRPSLFEDPV